MTKNLNRQHEKILFMISLPQTAEFEACNEYVSECVNRLRERGVDVCESIHREDLATINQYSIVIIVAHHDTDEDALFLSDGKLPMGDFVSSIPEDFSGELDFSSCYSASVMKAIKDRCPNCHIQASSHQTALPLRLTAYPYVIDIINEDQSIEYHDAYMKVLDMMLEAAPEDAPEGEEEEKELVKLGKKMSSIYAPEKVMRDSPFKIMVFLHYDAEKKVVKLKAQRWQTNATIRDEFDIPISLKENDKISIVLSFDSTDDANIKVKNDEYYKTVTLKADGGIEEEFVVTILSGFKGNGILANVEMVKDEVSFVRCAFNIDVVDSLNETPAEVVAEVPVIPEKAEEIILCYSNVFTGRIFGHNNFIQFRNTIKKKANNEERLFFIRKFIYNNDLFIKQLSAFLQEKEEELSKLSLQDAKKSEITFELLPTLRKYNSKLQKKLGVLEGKLLGIKKSKGETVIFENSVLKFPSIEWSFIDIASEIKNLDCQIDMLKVFRELRDELKKSEKGKIQKDEIKELVTQFLEHPHNDHVDQDLYHLFKNSGTGSIIHSRSKGATTPFLALVLAMVEKEYVSIDNRGEDWFINVERYIDLSKNEGSLRTIKSRINKLVSLLENKDVLGKIKNYQKTDAGKISITAYYLLKVKVSIT